jgi:hypothetical protein
VATTLLCSGSEGDREFFGGERKKSRASVAAALEQHVGGERKKRMRDRV